MTSMSGSDVGNSSYGADNGRERGARRKKLAAMAGSVYRAGATAVNEIKESYSQTRSGEMDAAEIAKITIPGSFPDVAIVTKGNEQMVLFPSYAKRHIRKSRQFADPAGPPPSSSMGMDEQDYWRQEWARHEDEKAIVDVDVRGWIYNPHKGPMTRRNRILIGLARQLSGIPVPRVQQPGTGADADLSIANAHLQREEERERESIAREAREIERRGRAEEAAAQQGEYSERPKDESSEDEGDRRRHQSRSPAAHNRPSRPPSPTPSLRTNTMGTTALSDAELVMANANLMARIGPFMTTPIVDLPITLFFFNDTQSQSRTVVTDDSGHFNMRAALDFIPTHVRVLANEDISCTEPVQLIESQGVSLISDIDDTIKRSNISLGTKEIFRNTFVRELKDLTVEGVTEWYTCVHNMGVRVHYCSNSPWQLYPVLATYFKLACLPPGSLHLKRYSGMLQGIFEPVAERKKGTLEKIMNDFPERKFLLVGDSGEADLEVYTELAVANPGRIKGIFIRDVTTPEQLEYFDSAYDAGGKHKPHRSRDDSRAKPVLPPRDTASSRDEGSEIGDLIDFSDDPVLSEQTTRQMASTTNPRSRQPPLKPAKPSALQSTTAVPTMSTKNTASNSRKMSPTPPPPPPPRRSFPSSDSSTKSSSLHPLSQTHNSSEQTSGVSSSSSENSSQRLELSRINSMPPTLPPRRGTPSSLTSTSPHPLPSRRRTGDSDISAEPFVNNTIRRSNTSSPGTTTPPSGAGASGQNSNQNQAPVNKKIELWKRRLERAHDTLSQYDVPLYTWRRGEDVVEEAVGIVRDTLKELKMSGDR